MNVTKIGTAIAATLLIGTTAFAQADKQIDKQASMTVSGCLMQEADYRKAHNLGKGFLGGAGLGDEFVLVEGNCNDTSAGKAYRLTGKEERELKPFVGKRIEVTGRWDHKRDAKTAAGETNAKLPPEIRIASFHEATVTNAPAAASAAPAATPEIPSAPKTVASNETTTSDRRLPKTASNLPLVGLIGVLSLCLWVGVRFARFGSA